MDDEAQGVPEMSNPAHPFPSQALAWHAPSRNNTNEPQSEGVLLEQEAKYSVRDGIAWEGNSPNSLYTQPHTFIQHVNRTIEVLIRHFSKRHILVPATHKIISKYNPPIKSRRHTS